jgi:hypothetical protein
MVQVLHGVGAALQDCLTGDFEVVVDGYPERLSAGV